MQVSAGPDSLKTPCMQANPAVWSAIHDLGWFLQKTAEVPRQVLGETPGLQS